MSITQEQLKELLTYDAVTGAFVWKANRSGPRNKTGLAGYINSQGYRSIGIGFKRYQAHRLAWLYITGHFPEGLLDHKDGIRSNNSWPNLREVGHAQNCANKKLRSNSLTGVKNVQFRKDIQRYQVVVKKKSYGCYDDLELADLVAKEARISVYGEFFNHG